VRSFQATSQEESVICFPPVSPLPYFPACSSPPPLPLAPHPPSSLPDQPPLDGVGTLSLLPPCFAFFAEDCSLFIYLSLFPFCSLSHFLDSRRRSRTAWHWASTRLFGFPRRGQFWKRIWCLRHAGLSRCWRCAGMFFPIPCLRDGRRATANEVPEPFFCAPDGTRSPAHPFFFLVSTSIAIHRSFFTTGVRAPDSVAPSNEAGGSSAFSPRNPSIGQLSFPMALPSFGNITPDDEGLTHLPGIKTGLATQLPSLPLSFSYSYSSSEPPRFGTSCSPIFTVWGQRSIRSVGALSHAVSHSCWLPPRSRMIYRGFYEGPFSRPFFTPSFSSHCSPPVR